MRVIFISPHSDPLAKLGEPDAGGQCIYENELALSLASHGIEVITFCRQRNHHEPITHVTQGYTIYRITAGGERFIPKENIGGVLPEFTRKVAAILSKTKKDKETIIHSHYWDGAAAALYLKANYQDLPLIWTPHSLGYVKRERYRGLGNESFYHFIPRLAWESYGATIANRVITLSRNEKRKLTQYYGINPARISVIAPGITVGQADEVEKYRKGWNLTSKSNVLLCIGRMSRNKGYHHAIRLAAQLKNFGISDYTLIIVGGSSHPSSLNEKQYKYSLKKLANKLGIQNKVIFQPSIDHHHISSIYALADIYLMTSENEPFGMTAIEAMITGKTVVAHNRGGTRDILKNGKTGFLVDIHDYPHAAELVAKLLQRKSHLQKIGEQARLAAQEKYSWQSRLPAFLKAYQDLKNIFPNRLKRLLPTDQYLSKNLQIE